MRSLLAGAALAIDRHPRNALVEPRREQRGARDVAGLLAETAAAGCGAVVLFLGTVRNRQADREVTAITYSAFRPLAERTLAAIEAELGVEAAQIDGLLESGAAYRDLYRSGAYGYRLLRFRGPVETAG